jgi:hypothetical protein
MAMIAMTTSNSINVNPEVGVADLAELDLFWLMF